MSEVNIEIKGGDLPFKTQVFIMVGSLLLGMLFNVLFYEKIPAASCFIFVAAFYTMFFIKFKDNFKLTLSIPNALILFILILSANYGIHSNPIFNVLNVLLLPLLIATHTILFTNRNIYSWDSYRFINDLVYEVLYGAFAYIIKPFSLLAGLIIKKTDTPRHTVLKKVLIGLIISLPLLFIVIGLLASADDVFKGIMENVSNIFLRLNLNDFITQLIIFIIVSLLIFSYIWNLSLKQNRQWKESSLVEIKEKNLIDPVIVITILTMVCLIYAIFIFIQFTYLFGGINYSSSSTLTYSEYARKGFFELVAVTVINLTILVFNMNLTQRKNNSLTKVIQLLNTFLVICTTVMLYSAHYRMSLYEKAYGYTYLRFFTHAFMLYIFVLLVVSLIKVYKQSFPLAKLYIIISLLAYTMICYVNSDNIIANKNLDRYHKTGKVDVRYLSSLSYDAVPQMLSLYEELKLKDKASAESLEDRLYYKKKSLNDWNHWQSYNYSISRAKNLLDKYDFKKSEATTVYED